MTERQTPSRASLLRGLYAITPDWHDTARLLNVTEILLQSGCRLLQYRNKTTTPCHRQEQAVALRGLTHRFGALLIINDDLELAQFAEADGVHLGQDDGELERARQVLGPGKILGASCYHSAVLADQAVAAGADYIAFGSVYPSPTKPHAPRAGLELFSARQPLPVCAIGGITPDNAAPLTQAGADMLAVISALYDTADPAAAVHKFISLFAQPLEDTP